MRCNQSHQAGFRLYSVELRCVSCKMRVMQSGLNLDLRSVDRVDSAADLAHRPSKIVDCEHKQIDKN